VTCNVGGGDRIFRLVVAALAVVVAAIAPIADGWRIALGVIALIAGVTALVRYCPLNQALHIDTCNRGPTKTRS
jgi:uncharacterized membrane protein HdeD (DUF308 family)